MTSTSARKLIIAIDGPAGVGKSTIASRLARKLGYVNLESGAMYRALALKAIEWDVSFDDEPALDKLAHETRIVLEPTMGGNRVLLDGRDVSQRVRETGCDRSSFAGIGSSRSAPMDGRPPAGDGSGRRRGHGRPRHRHQSLSRSGRENLS